MTEKLRIVERLVDHWEERTYACIRGSRRRRTWVSSVDCEIYCSGGLAITGTYVAHYAAESCHPSSFCSAGVRVVNVASRRRSRGSGSAEWLYGFDVSYRGTAVWVESRDYNNPSEPRRVRALTLGGDDLTLDESTEIDLFSLALSDDRLYWMRAGEAQTTLVPN